MMTTSYPNSRQGNVYGRYFLNGLPASLITEHESSATCIVPTIDAILRVEIPIDAIQGSYTLQQTGEDDGLRNLFLQEKDLMPCSVLLPTHDTFIACNPVLASSLVRKWDAWQAMFGDDAPMLFANGFRCAQAL